MLEAIKKNKRNVVMMILFGAAGILVIPMILGIEKLSKKFPRAYKCVMLTIFCIIMAACIYGLFPKHQMNFLVVCICMAIAFDDIMKKENQ